MEKGFLTNNCKNKYKGFKKKISTKLTKENISILNKNAIPICMAKSKIPYRILVLLLINAKAHVNSINNAASNIMEKTLDIPKPNSFYNPLARILQLHHQNISFDYF